MSLNQIMRGLLGSRRKTITFCRHRASTICCGLTDALTHHSENVLKARAVSIRMAASIDAQFERTAEHIQGGSEKHHKPPGGLTCCWFWVWHEKTWRCQIPLDIGAFIKKRGPQHPSPSPGSWRSRRAGRHLKWLPSVRLSV